MAKLRSYNEELLIAASLIASVLNDIVIERRKHKQDRDYSKPINIKDILQKNIEVPCVFGDRSTILKSLQNHEGAIKLPLFVLQSGSIKSDEIRFADTHVDLIYQQDKQFRELPKNHPLYEPYDLRKRRPLPITIDYELSLLAKYKEDLDQMMTNWMVHCRPDLYVKWWHPRDKTMPLESEILWSHSLNYKKPDEQPTTRFQYEATTSFTFKTWIFPGLDYEEDAYDLDEGIIKYFNWFPTDINTTGVEGTDGYPTIGEFGAAPAGFYAVPTHMEFENDGSDEEGIKKGKYYINNLTKTPLSAYAGKDNGIKDIEATADILTQDVYSQGRLWQDYQGFCEFDNISNERIGIKAVYFEGGYPLSSMLVGQNPSGDFLFQHFCSEGNSKQDPISGFIGEIEEDDFGICFTESIAPSISYNFNNKQFIVSGAMENKRFGMNLTSIMCSPSGFYQGLEVYNVTNAIPGKTEKIKLQRQFDKDFNPILTGLCRNETNNITILNNTDFRKDTTPVKFVLETAVQKRKLQKLKDLIIQYWDDLEIYPCDEAGNRIESSKIKYNHYRLDIPSKFKQSLKNILEYNEISMFVIRGEYIYNNIEYTLIANNYLYFVLSDTDIFDWGIVSLPRFATSHYPIFKAQIENGKLTYGLGIDCNLASHFYQLQ